MAKKYKIQRDEESDLVTSIKITETKEVESNIDIMGLIAQKKRNLVDIDRLKEENKKITTVLKDINDNTEVKMADIPEAQDILK